MFYLILVAVILNSDTVYCNVINATNTGGELENRPTTEKYPESSGIYKSSMACDKDLVKLQDTINTLNEQLQNFNSLYIGRLDQKLTSLATNIANIDSNVKNIQDRAHVWDTFQLHVSAWNDQIKSVDKKVDIINSGQEKMALLEGKLSILLNLEYNSARIINKLTTIEDRLDQIDRSHKRQQSDILSTITQKESTTENLLNKNLPTIIKATDRKVDRLIGILQRNTPLGRRFARGRPANDTQPQKILIKCSTPPIIEETVKDVASKVDLIYDKILTDNISNDNCDSDDDRKIIENSDETVEDIENDFSVLVLNSDEDESESKPFKRQTRAIKGNLKNTKHRQHDKMTQNKRAGINTMISELQLKINTCVSLNFKNTSDHIEKSVNFHNDYKLFSEETNLENVVMKIEKLKAIFKTTCKYLIDEPTVEVEIKYNKICQLFSSREKNEDSDILTKCVNECEVLENTESAYTPIDLSETLTNKTISENGFSNACFKYIDNFRRISIADINTPEELTCFIVYAHSINKSIELCGETKSRFCDDFAFFIFQSRQNSSVKFSRSWNEYKWGFGNFTSGNYWIGNEALHVLTNVTSPAILRVLIKDFEGNEGWAEYDRFSISSESEGYRIYLSGYRGNCTDSLSYHSGSAFSTYDVRHDEAPACCPCSNSYGSGGWWFKGCFESNLNGAYFDPPRHPADGGISWELWRPNATLSHSTMALRFLPSSPVSTYNSHEPEDP